MPIGWVYDESNIIIARENARIHSEVSLIQTAVSSILGPKGFAQFKQSMQSLQTDVEPKSEVPRRPPPEED